MQICNLFRIQELKTFGQLKIGLDIEGTKTQGKFGLRKAPEQSGAFLLFAGVWFQKLHPYHYQGI
jgi:hypothetical protein